ncbi:MAG: hypothetical protein H0U74_00925 [Bradymonadaceae bacterium]|nr:hypothetical protein [Lujinxingiaceae bacterium]
MYSAFARVGRITLTVVLACSLLAACKDKDKDDASSDKASAAQSAQSAESTKEGCKELVQTTKTYCTEAMNRGLNLSCLQPITGIHTAMDQRDGNLFQVGDNDTKHAISESACNTYLGMFREKHAEATPPTNVRAQPPAECVSLQALVIKGCLDPLGTKKVPEFCHLFIGSVASGHDADEENRGVICADQQNLLAKEM